MRISDWSSDVCSSDLQRVLVPAPGIGRLEALGVAGQQGVARIAPAMDYPRLRPEERDQPEMQEVERLLVDDAARARPAGRPGQRSQPVDMILGDAAQGVRRQRGRKSGGSGKRV